MSIRKGNTKISALKVDKSGADLKEYFNYQPETMTVQSAVSWFKNNYFKKLESIEIPDSCTNASGIFYECGAYLTLPGLKNGTNNKYLYNLYYNCNNITSVELSELKSDNVESTLSMFYGCSKLTEIDLSNCKWTKLLNSREMFNSCTKIKKIKFGTGYTTNNFQYSLKMFYNCTALEELDLGDLDFSHITNYASMFYNVPNNCYILCKDETNKNWITSIFTNLTNVHYRGEE